MNNSLTYLESHSVSNSACSLVRDTRKTISRFFDIIAYRPRELLPRWMTSPSLYFNLTTSKLLKYFSTMKFDKDSEKLARCILFVFGSTIQNTLFDDLHILHVLSSI